MAGSTWKSPRTACFHGRRGGFAGTPPAQHALFVQRSKEMQLKGRDSVGPCVLFRMEK